MLGAAYAVSERSATLRGRRIWLPLRQRLGAALHDRLDPRRGLGPSLECTGASRAARHLLLRATATVRLGRRQVRAARRLVLALPRPWWERVAEHSEAGLGGSVEIV